MRERCNKVLGPWEVDKLCGELRKKGQVTLLPRGEEVPDSEMAVTKDL
jgi:hypothetical protein